MQVKMPTIIKKGEWIDLYVPEYGGLVLKAGVMKLIDLGIAMKLPEGFEAIIAPRSSTPGRHKIMLANSIGIIDNSYCGNNDRWKFCAYALCDTLISGGDRICQFRIQLSQKATIWQKLKWLFCSGVELIEVESLESPDRGGIGSTRL